MVEQTCPQEQGHRSLFSVRFSHPKASAMHTAGSNQLPVRRMCPGEVPGNEYWGDELSLFHETFPKWLPKEAPLGCHVQLTACPGGNSQAQQMLLSGG